MVGVLRNIHGICRYQRMASITAICICILCQAPLEGNCLNSREQSNHLVSEVLDQVDLQNSSALQEKLDVIFEESDDPLAEGRKFLQSFVNQMNARYGLTLTIPQACTLVRENLHKLSIPVEAQDIILKTIELLESNLHLSIDQKHNFGEAIERNCANIEWRIWVSSEKEKIPQKYKHTYKGDTPIMGKELPANCYLGGCELLAGALICLVPVPGAFWVGRIMIGDGVRRLIDGAVQLSDERRFDPTYIPPKSPFGFDF